MQRVLRPFLFIVLCEPPAVAGKFYLQMMKQRQSKLCCCELQPFLPTGPAQKRPANPWPDRQSSSSETGPHRMTDTATPRWQGLKTVRPY